jgi:hypothetical protein
MTGMTAAHAARRLAELAPMPAATAPDQALILARQFAVSAQRSLRRLEHGDGPAAGEAARLYAQYAALTMLCTVWDKDPAAADAMARAIREAAEDNLTGQLHDILTTLGISPAEVDQLDDILRQDEDRQRTAHTPDPALTAAFRVTAGDDGTLIVSAPCTDTIGCLWTTLLGRHATLGELTTTAAAHTGQAAGDLHATLAGLVTAPAGINDGRPALHSATAGGWVCAIPHPGHPDDICGAPVGSHPCPLHPATSKESTP